VAVPIVPRSASAHVSDYALHHRGIHACESRSRAPRAFVEHAFRVSPERAEHPIGRVAPNRHYLDACPAAQPSGEQARCGKDAPVQLGDFGQVVGHQPHLAADDRIVGEDDDRVAGNAAQLLDPAFQLVVPVMDGQYRHRGVSAPVAQR
jgi:hypothetical protein